MNDLEAKGLEDLRWTLADVAQAFNVRPECVQENQEKRFNRGDSDRMKAIIHLIKFLVFKLFDFVVCLLVLPIMRMHKR